MCTNLDLFVWPFRARVNYEYKQKKSSCKKDIFLHDAERRRGRKRDNDITQTRHITMIRSKENIDTDYIKLITL